MDYLSDQEVLEQAAKRHRESAALAAKIVERDRTIPFITALIMAGDRLAAADGKKAMQAGEPFESAIWYAGSYARCDLALWARENGHVTDELFFEMWPELWRGSDPDDTDPRFLDTWREARERNGGMVLDGPAPRRGAALTAYRGQDPGVLPGIAWTADRKIARRFADGAALRRANRGGLVLRARVPRHAILAYLTGRNEKELVVDVSQLAGWEVVS